MVFGITYYSFFEYKVKPSLIYDQEFNITGRIVKKPEVDYKSQKIVVQISNLSNSDGSKIKTEEELLLVNLPHYPKVNFGDTIKFKGRIVKPGMIEDFDYEKYLKRYLIFGLVMQPKDPIAFEEELNFGYLLKKQLFSISEHFEGAINRVLPEPEASLSAGLILGIKKNLPDDFKDALSATGLTHIIALSGYNVTIIIAVLGQILLGYFSRKQVFYLGTSLIILFVIMTGAAPSIVRAAIFSLMILFGKTIGRAGDFTNLLLFAALIMIFFNPYVLAYDVGFQLSFLAFAGLIYISPVVKKLFEKGFVSKIPEGPKSILIETLSAQIAVAPLILAIFGRISIISPLSNLLVLGVIPIAMALSFLTGIGTLIYYPLGKLLVIFTWPVLLYIIKSIEIMAKIPFASINFSKSWVLAILLCFFIVIWLYASVRKYKIRLL